MAYEPIKATPATSRYGDTFDEQALYDTISLPRSDNVMVLLRRIFRLHDNEADVGKY